MEERIGPIPTTYQNKKKKEFRLRFVPDYKSTGKKKKRVPKHPTTVKSLRQVSPRRNEMSSDHSGPPGSRVSSPVSESTHTYKCEGSYLYLSFIIKDQSNPV